MDTNLGSSGTPDPNLPPQTVDPTCVRPKNLFDVPAQAPALSALSVKMLGAAPAGVDLMHFPNAKFYAVNHYDHSAAAVRTQHLLTVDVANMISSSDSSNLSFISDIYVFRQDNSELLYWKRLADKSMTASAMILLDPALVTAGRKLTVIVVSEMHGHYGQTVDLAQAPLDYKQAVATFVSGAAYGGATLQRPYVANGATGGQGDIGSLHSPHFHSVANTEVQVTLGPKTAKHGRYAENHYMAGALLFDQNGNLLGTSEQTYASAANHNFVFSGLNLSDRKVSNLRCVVLDTLNGILQGFVKVA
jgi:hypothetical protein